MLTHEEEMTARDIDIVLLKAWLLTLKGKWQKSMCNNTSTSIIDDMQSVEWSSGCHLKRGKPLSIEPFTGNKAEQLWDDWLLINLKGWYLVWVGGR